MLPRRWQTTLVGIALLAALALPGCKAAEAAYGLLEASNPVFFVVSKYFLRPMFDAMKDSLGEFGLELVEKLPPGLRETVNTVLDLKKRVEELQSALTKAVDIRTILGTGAVKTKEHLRAKLDLLKQLKARHDTVVAGSTGSPQELSAATAPIATETARTEKEVAVLNQQSAGQQREMDGKDREITSLKTQLVTVRRDHTQARETLQTQLKKLDLENGFLRQRLAEVIARINASAEVLKSPLLFRAVDEYDEFGDRVVQVVFREKEFHRVAWGKQIASDFKNWNPRHKPIVVDLQQRVLVTALAMKEFPGEFDLLETEIRSKVAAEGENYHFNITRKKK